MNLSISVIKYIIFSILTTTRCFTVSDIQKESDTFKCKSPKGWKCAFNVKFSQKDTDYSYCDFDVITLDTSVDEFVEKYYMKKPVVINVKLSDWTDTSFWEKQNLLHSFGKYELSVDKSLNLVYKKGYAQGKISLDQYVRRNDGNFNNYSLKEPLYIFDRSIEEQHKILSNHVQTKNIKFFNYASSNLDYNSQIFAMGPTGTGASFHAHGENWLFVLMGQKRLFVYPPNLAPAGGYFPGYSAKDWFEFVYPRLNLTYAYDNHDSNPDYDFSFEFHNYNKLNKMSYSVENYTIANIDDIFGGDYNEFKPLECIAHPGQIIYVPEFWWHSVLNIGDTAAIAVQTSDCRQLWMLERRFVEDVKRETENNNDWTVLENQVNLFEAIKAYNRLKKYSPLSAVNEFFMGFLFYGIENQLYFPNAIKHFRNAILMDSTYIEAYIHLSMIYSLKGGNNWENKYYDIDKAENLLRIAYLLNPNNQRIQQHLIHVFEIQHDTESTEIVKNKQPLPLKNY